MASMGETFTLFAFGTTDNNTGGMLSLGPPLGAAVVLAQECEAIQKKTVSSMSTMVVIFLFIINIYSTYVFNSFDLPDIIYQSIQVASVVDIQIYVAFKNLIVGDNFNFAHIDFQN